MRLLLFLFVFLSALLQLRGETIREFHVHIAAESNGTVHVTEEILYDFQTSFAPGFVRILPLIDNHSKLQIINDNDQSVVTHMDIKQEGKPMLFAVEEKFSGRYGPMLRILFGTPNQYYSGLHRYILSYTLDNALHPIEYGKKVALYWALPSTERRATIEHFTMDIELPKDWNTSQVTLQGHIGALPIESQQIHRKGPRTLSIEATAIASIEPIAIEVSHPAKGLLERLSASRQVVRVIINYLAPFVLLGLYLLWLRRRRNQNPPTTPKRTSLPVRYNPPKGLSFLQSAYVHSEGLSIYYIFPAILDLAQKGILTIEQIFDKVTLQRVRSKDTSALSDDERYLLEGILFPLETNSRAIEHKSSAEREVFRDRFDTLLDKLQDWAVKEGYFSKKRSEAQREFFIHASLIAIPIFILLTISFMLLAPQSDATQLFTPSLFFNLGGLMAAFVIYLFVWTWKKRSIGGGVIALFFLGLFLLFSRLFLSPACTSTMDVLLCPHLWAYGLITYLAIREGFRVTSYTSKGMQTYEQMEGYKQFVSDVESIRLQQMLRENPLYLDNHLPYALYFEEEKSWGDIYDKLRFIVADWFRKDTD